MSETKATDFEVWFSRVDGCPGFVFKRPVDAREAHEFFDDTGVWPIQMVDGVLCATNPAKRQR